MRRNKNALFCRNESSVFVLQSPFQILCAASAIKHYGIEDYEILLVLPTGEVRNEQAINMIELLGLRYKIINGARVSNKYRLSLLFNMYEKYERAFLGYYEFEDGYYYCLKYLKKGGSLVFLDDGCATITLLTKGFSPQGRERFVYRYYKWLLKLRGIRANNLFTVYDGIKNPRWNIEINNLSRLNSEKKGLEKQGVFFVGTNSVVYYPALNGGESEYKEMLDSNLRNIRMKFPEEIITYIPHGREILNYIEGVCSKYNICYKKVETNIEIYMMGLPYPPKAIYGYTSSALFNLKKLFPTTDVVNILPEINGSKLYEDMKGISEYYELQGISTIKYKKGI